jgi:hypothetical protein
MNTKFSLSIIAIFLVVFLGGCKFYFSESEYLGTYVGSFTSDTPLYKSCGATLILTDVGDHFVNLELMTDSNPTFYFTNLQVDRGHFIASADLRIDGGNVDAWINRNTHYIAFVHYSSSYYDYRFDGTRQ